MKPMTPEDAIIQMERLGHAFFVFRNAQTEEISVLYRRRSGDYGVIEPE
jgi:putative sigma-54 modulation protein